VALYQCMDTPLLGKFQDKFPVSEMFLVEIVGVMNILIVRHILYVC